MGTLFRTLCIQSSPYFSTTRFHEHWIRSTVPFPLSSVSLIPPEIYFPVFVFITQKKNRDVQKGKYDVINYKPSGQTEMKENSDDVTAFRIAKLTRATLAADWLALAT